MMTGNPGDVRVRGAERQASGSSIGLARPSRLPAEQRREHLLDAAADLIHREGVESVTMEAVAAAAGVSKGLGYAYFTNRGDLLLQLLDRELKELERRVIAALEHATDFESQIRAQLRAWFDVVEERGTLLGTLLQAGQIQGPLRERHSVVYRQLEEFYGLLAVGAFEVDKQKAVAAAAVLLSGLAGIIERWVECGDDRKTLEDAFVALAVGGLQHMADGG